MTALEPEFITGAVLQARKSLSGKRVALVGFPKAAAARLSQAITEAEGFIRHFASGQVDPSADVLKPFELIILDVESAAGTAWFDSAKLAAVSERCVAVADHPTLLHLVQEAAFEFREYCDASLPLEEFLLRCATGLRCRPHSAHRPAVTGSTVVLADDDTSITSIVRRALERNGLQCQVAANGREALTLITEVKPCAAILDVHMPSIDGFEVLSRIKSVPALAHTRVLLLTGCEQEADVLRGFTLGADDYVCKPFNPMELTIRLMRALGRI